MKVVLYISLILAVSASNLNKRALQKSHERSQLQKWEDKFFQNSLDFDQTKSLVYLLNEIAFQELSGCTTLILYDTFTENSNDLLLEQLFRNYPLPYIHGQITEEYKVRVPKLLKRAATCMHYILFLKDVMRSKTIIGSQNTNKVVIIARSSQWRVYEFLNSEESQSFLNLLVIAKSEKIQSSKIELPFILYTHKLYVDALGSSMPQVITSWRNKSFSTNAVLFPRKVSTGFAGHRFIISLADQPPFVIKTGRNDNNDIQWDGIEIRLVELLAKMFNFTTDYREAANYNSKGSADAVVDVVKSNKANIGIAGLYVTKERVETIDSLSLHSQDCASFISLTSTALPKYRAIMGPFHWSVWISLTMAYLVAILPLAFSDKHSLRILIEKPEEIENMFWYVFGTFTNAFTFGGENSWSKTDKLATRLLIGFYWMFTIIVTACYTGSIIAFVTLPVYPATVDTPEQFLRGRYQVGTLDRGGWQHWFENSSDPITVKLFKHVDLVPDVHSGLKNITKAFFWPYAFLGSRAQLDYIVRTNFTTQSKRSVMHISTDCFASFGVALIFEKNSLYGKMISMGVLRVVQGGFMIKMKADVEWQMIRSSTGKLLSANSIKSSVSALTVEDRALTLDDTQGMFLLLGIGFLLGGASLLSEWMGGCVQFCKRRFAKSANNSIQSNYRSHDTPTPREKLNSLTYNSFGNHRIDEDIDEEPQTSKTSNCIVHQEDDANIDEQIDKLFQFENVFGDQTSFSSQPKEELEEENNLKTNHVE